MFKLLNGKWLVCDHDYSHISDENMALIKDSELGNDYELNDILNIDKTRSPSMSFVSAFTEHSVCKLMKMFVQKYVFSSAVW